VLPINEIIQGDCLEVMKRFPDNFFDSIVTDPPYEFGFMNKKWDSSGIAYNVEMWKECLRVLKPGGHLLSFGGSRTYHRMACAIEDAGFEIRDQVQWIYGSGFPKSQAIGKAIDSLKKNEWLNIGKALDKIERNDIIKVWKTKSNNVKLAENQSLKRATEAGISMQKKRFCSRGCSAKKQSRKVECSCGYCGLVFYRSPSHKHKNHYCSPECRSRDKTVTNPCDVCGKVITRPKSQSIYEHFYCSMRCQGMAKRKHGGQSQGRRSPEDLAWKAEVLKRGCYRCAVCDTDRNLEAHHIKSIEDFPELRHDTENGMCVCHECHYYGIHNGAPNYKHGRYSKK